MEDLESNDLAMYYLDVKFSAAKVEADIEYLIEKYHNKWFWSIWYNSVSLNDGNI